jgi:Nitroreductase family
MTTLSQCPPWKVLPEDFPADFPIQEQLKYLLQYAVLAPSTKNTQPWRFSIGENTIGVFADLTRSQPVADCGRRELYISLGCALENLLVASEQFAFRHEVTYFPQSTNDELAAIVNFHQGGRPSIYRAGITLASIIARHTERGSYREEPVTKEVRDRLLHSCDTPGLRVDLTDDPRIRSRVVELNLHADEMEFADPAFRQELGYWVGQGVFSTGTPRLLSRLTGLLLSRVNLGRAIGKRNAALLSGAPLVGLISARTDDRTSQVRTGQALERLWLHATRIGIALQPMSQALEVPSLRAELARVIPESGWIPEQVFRIGYPIRPPEQHTPRRSLDQVVLG